MLRDMDSLIATAKALNMTPEQYRQSRERLQILQAYIDNGKDAETVRDFADAIVKEVGREVNEKMLEPNSDLNLLRGYYRGAILFQKKVLTVIQMGEQKRATLDAIKKSQKE